MADITAGTGQREVIDADLLSRVEPEHTIEGRNPTKADVLCYEVEGDRVAVKTYAQRGFFVRNVLGRWLIRREAAAYRAAGESGALPAFLGRLGPFAIATRWLDARPLREKLGATIDEGVFDRLERAVGELHRRGVALADLHHRDVLLGEDGAVYVIDLATAWVLGRHPGPIRKYLFTRLCESDRVNLARMRARFTGGDIEAAVASVTPAARTWHRRGRWLKSIVNGLRGKR